MKKLLTIILMSALGLQAANAQDRVEKFGFFDHLGIGVALGTSGVDIELATPLGDYLQLRAGYSFMPKFRFKYKSDVDYTKHGNVYKGEVEGHVKWGNGKVLLDYYPFLQSTFHVTAGAFFGSDEIADATNIDRIENIHAYEGIVIGDYLIMPDADGYAKAAIKVNKFKPYVGIGFGRSLPRKRVAVGCDLGVQFWGKPGVYEKQSGHDVKVESKDIGDKDGGVIKTISKISVLPVMTIRLTGRIF